MENKFNISIYNIDDYLFNSYKIYKNCIYVTIDFGRIRYIKNNKFGIDLYRDYNVDL